MTIAVVLVNAAALVGLGLALRLLGGDRLGAAGLLAGGLALWGLGGDVPSSVWNPYVVALPFACFVALVVAAAAGRHRALPWALAVGSFVMQTHLSYVGLVGLLSAWAIAAVAWSVIRAGRTAGSGDARLEVRREARRLAAWCVGVLAVLWAVPVGQQVTGRPGNLGQIVRSTLGGGGEAVGSRGLGELGRVVGLPLLGLRPQGDLVRVLPALGVGSALALALPFVTLVGLALAVRRRGPSGSDPASSPSDQPAAPSLGAVLATLAVVLLAGAITATRIPLADGVQYQYYGLWMWPIGALTWLLVGWVAVTLRPPAPGGPAGDAVDRLVGAGQTGRGPTVAVAVLLVVAAGIALLPRPGAWAPWAADRRIAGATVPDVVDAAADAGAERALVRFRGGTAYLSTGSAVVTGLEHDGVRTSIDPGVPTEVFPWGERRRWTDQPVDIEVWVVSGADPADLPADARLVAEAPTLTPAEAADHERVQRDLLAAAADGLEPGPRAPSTDAQRAALAAADLDPATALGFGTVATLAAQGVVAPPGGDLHRVFTAARLQALADEATVRVYLVTPTR